MPQGFINSALSIPSIVLVENQSWMDRGVNDPWTIEFWYFNSSLSALPGTFFTIGPYGCATIGYGAIGYSQFSTYAVYKQPTTPCVPLTSSIISAYDTWTHFAIVNDGGTRKFYRNGTLLTSEVNSAIVTNGPINPSGASKNRHLLFGNERDPRDSDPIEVYHNLNGGISNFRWTNAVVYTGNFSVPTSPLTALPDTKLLLFQGTNLTELLTDNSGNPVPNTILNFGANYGTYGPFAPPFDNQGCFYGGILPYKKYDNLFAIPKVNEASLTTDVITSVTGTTASCAGTITQDDNTPVVKRGVCWMEAGTQLATTAIASTNWTGTDFTTGYTHTPGSTVALSTNISGELGKTYYIEITVLNSTVGTFNLNFGSLGVTAISSSRVIIYDNNLFYNPTDKLRIVPLSSFDGTIKIAIYDSIPTALLPTKTEDGSGLGTFTSNMTGLTPGKRYFVRAYATTEYLTNYGKTLAFTSPCYNYEITNTGVGNLNFYYTKCDGTVDFVSIAASNITICSQDDYINIVSGNCTIQKLSACL